MRAKMFLSAVLALCLTLTPIRAAAPGEPDENGEAVAEMRTEAVLEETGTPETTEEAEDAPDEAAQLFDGDEAPTSGTCGEHLTWELDAEGKLTISGEGAMTNYTVRNGVAGTPWYALREQITSVTIANGATSVGNYAFYNCSALTEITIPARATSLGNYAFYNCSAMTGITIPASVTEIGKYAFSGCSKLESVEIPNGVTAINERTFNSCSSLTAVTIPASVTTIGEYAFSECRKLQKVSIPNGVTSIAKAAFIYCNALTEVSIPDSVTEIGGSAFYWCSALTEVSIPASVTEISGSAFSGCSKLEAVTIPNGVTTIGESAFASCSSLSEVTIPDSVTKIGGYAFSSCTSLTKITIPASVTELGQKAFASCAALTEAVLSNGVAVIGASAFSGCTALTSVSIPASVTEIPGNAFSGCAALSALQVDAQNQRFSSEDGVLFSKAKTELIRYPVGKEGESYVVPRYVRQIAPSALSGCEHLKSVIIAQGVTSVGDSAFSGCSALEEISLPESLASIGASAFSGCKALTEVKIPGGVTEIGENAFRECAALSVVKFSDGVSVIGRYMFYGCAALTEISIPASVAEIGEGAFSGCTGLTDVKISSGVTKIGQSAFSGCTGLTELTLPASVTEFSLSGLPSSLTAIHVSGGNATYSSRDGALMSGDRTSVLYYPRGKADESWIVPNGVTSIASGAFSSCRALQSVTLPEGLQSVGNNAFSSCRELKAVTLPEGLESIGSSAFYDCESLSAINFPDGLKSIGNNAFQYCYQLETVKLPDSVESIGSGAFHYCVSLSDVTLSAGLTGLPDSLFYHCFHLPCLTVPEGVTNISYNCFSLCESLAKIAIPQGATGFAAALSSRDSLTDIYYGGSEEAWKEAIGDAEFTAKVHFNAYAEGKEECVRKNPVMALTKVPAYGTGFNFEGVVFREDGGEFAASGYRVTLYVQSGDSYFVKPTAAEPFVNLEEDGSFSIWYTSGGVPDSRATRIHLLLLSATYMPTGDFEADKAAALDYVLVTRTAEGGAEVSPNREASAKSAAPRIALTYCPVYGERKQFQGIVYAPDGSELNPKDYRISLYLQTALGGTYWVKPYYATPYASVNDDCTFSISYLTGGIDGTAVSIHIMLIPGDFTPYTDNKTYADTVAAALDYVHVGRDDMGGVRVAPERQIPGKNDDDEDAGIPLNLPIEEKKIAVNVGFYTDGSNPGDALSADIIRAQLQAVSRFSNVVRFYSASGETYKAYEIAHSMGLTVLGGAWLSGDEDADKAEMDALIEHCNKGYAKLAIVGSETQLRRISKPQEKNVSMETLIADIAYVRERLTNKSVPVTTADSIDILRSSRPLRKACDLIMPNCYPYFNSVSNQDAAAYFAIAMDSLRSVCGKKEIIVSETGLPTAGDAKGDAKVGGAEAAAYFNAIRDWSVKNETQVLFFEATDEAWKKADEGEIGAHWGIMSSDFAVKPDYLTTDFFSSVNIPAYEEYEVEYDGNTKTSTAVSLTNRRSTTADITFIVAAYASNGRMVSCSVTSESMGISESVTASVSYASDADVSIVKAFILSDAFIPLREAWSRKMS